MMVYVRKNTLSGNLQLIIFFHNVVFVNGEKFRMPLVFYQIVHEFGGISCVNLINLEHGKRHENPYARNFYSCI